MIGRLVSAALDRNWLAAWRLARRCGVPRGLFACRGRMQLALGRSSRVDRPDAPVLIGIRLLGDATPRHDVTVVAVGERASLALDGALIGRGARLVLAKGATLRMGRGSYLTDGSRIFVSQRVDIGARCAISWGVTIFDDDGHGFGPPPYSAPIVIEDDVWVGCNVTVLKGVTVGRGSVIAAGAVVSRSCPPGSLIGGVPARVLRSGIAWSDGVREGPCESA